MSTAVVGVDPRIRARRIAVARAEGRRRLHVLAVAAGLVVVAAAAWGLSRTSLLDVDRIAVAGADPARSAEVLATSQLSLGRPMALLDVDGAERAVAALPWVRSARVWQDWPSTVRIAVEPRVAAVTVPAAGGRSALVDSKGYVIGWATASDYPGASGGAADSGLPRVDVVFTGRLGDIHTAADGPLAVVAAMPDDLRSWVRTLTVDESHTRVGLELVGGASALLGEPVLIDDKIASLRAVLAGTDLACITEIDVTMPDLPTVVRHSPCLR